MDWLTPNIEQKQTGVVLIVGEIECLRDADNLCAGNIIPVSEARQSAESLFQERYDPHYVKEEEQNNYG